MRGTQTWYQEIPLFLATIGVVASCIWAAQKNTNTPAAPRMPASVEERTPLSGDLPSGFGLAPAGVLSLPCPGPKPITEEQTMVEVPSMANAISLHWPHCKGIQSIELSVDGKSILTVKHPIAGWRSEFFSKESGSAELRFLAKGPIIHRQQKIAFKRE
jgi:hypothetical protein